MQHLLKYLSCTTICGLLLVTCGCQGLAAILDKTSDPHELALYKPKQDTMVILVEDYQNPAVIELVADHMDRLIADELVTNKVAPIVNPQKLTLLRLDHPEEYRKMKLPDIGKELGGRQLLYANVTEFVVSAAAGTDTMKGHAQARVRIVDCQTGETLWPHDGSSAGHPIDADIPFAADAANTNPTAVRDALGKTLAQKIARLFYDATVDQPDPAPKYPESDLQ